MYNKNIITLEELYICSRLLNAIVVNFKLFKQYLNESFIGNFIKYAESLIERKTFNSIIILSQIIDILRRLNKNTICVENSLGLAYEQRIKELNYSFASLSLCIDAINVYKRVDNQLKVDELKNLYEEISKNTRFGSISAEIPVEEIYKEADKCSDEIIEKSSNEIINILTYDKSLLPTYDLVIEQAKKNTQMPKSFINGKINFKILYEFILKET
jgi:hypothetical protein